MISQISISNFRGIKETKIEDLARINLFIGKNNSAKSSILEALCFAKIPFKPIDEIGRDVMSQLLNRRVQRRRLSLEEFVYNYNMKNKISLVFTFGAKEIPLEVTCNENWIDFDVKCPVDEEVRTVASIRNWPGNPNSQITRLLEGSSGGQSPNPLEYMKSVIPSFQVADDMKPVREYWDDNFQNFVYLSETELIDDSFINRMEQFERDFWDRLLKGRTDKEVTSILNKVYETEIEHFTFKPYYFDRERRREGDSFKLFSALPELAMHVDDYGDGFRYAFSILTAAKLFVQRSLLIEEIESHQHPGSLRRLIDTLMDIAFENKLQLFITTHNDLVLRFVWYHFRPVEGKVDERANDVRFFHVTRENETGKVECTPIDIHNAADANQLISDIFELTDNR